MGRQRRWWGARSYRDPAPPRGFLPIPPSLLHWFVFWPSPPPSLFFFTLPPALNFSLCGLFYFFQLLVKPLFFLVFLLSLSLPPSLSLSLIIIYFLISASLCASISLPVSLLISVCLSLAPSLPSSPPLLSSPASSSSSSWRVGATQWDPDPVRQMLPRPVTKEVVSLATESAGTHSTAPSLSYYSKY